MVGKDMDIKEVVKTCKVLLLDIEGTTTSISFVKDEMFPFARDNAQKYLESQWSEPCVLKAVEGLRKLAAEDRENKLDGFQDIPTEDKPKEEQIEGLVKNLTWLMSEDRKVGPLKTMQGLIWKSGFQSGALTGHVYDDVAPALELWHSGEDRRVFVYSSGSIFAQKLLFGNTQAGDLRGHLTGYFDTEVGAKTEAQSYRNIVNKINATASEVLFLTDIYEEAAAAIEAGLNAALVLREGNLPLPPSAASVTQLQSFADLSVAKKRKADSQEDQPAKVAKKDEEVTNGDAKTKDKPEEKTKVKPEEIAEETSEAKSEETSEAMSVEISEAKSEETSEAKSQDSSEAKSQDSPEAKSEDSSDAKSEDSSEAKSEETSEGITETVVAEPETETMEVEESVPESNTQQVKEDIPKIVVEEITDSNEASLPAAETVPTVEEAEDKEADAKMETESSENSEDSTEKTTIEEISSTVNETVEDTVPVIEEPSSGDADMADLRSVGEVLDKECIEILSKVNDITNLDNISTKMAATSKDDMNEGNGDTSDIVDSILDKELEMEMKQDRDNEAAEAAKKEVTEAPIEESAEIVETSVESSVEATEEEKDEKMEDKPSNIVEESLQAEEAKEEVIVAEEVKVAEEIKEVVEEKVEAEKEIQVEETLKEEIVTEECKPAEETKEEEKAVETEEIKSNDTELTESNEIEKIEEKIEEQANSSSEVNGKSNGDSVPVNGDSVAVNGESVAVNGESVPQNGGEKKLPEIKVKSVEEMTPEQPAEKAQEA